MYNGLGGAALSRRGRSYEETEAGFSADGGGVEKEENKVGRPRQQHYQAENQTVGLLRTRKRKREGLIGGTLDSLMPKHREGEQTNGFKRVLFEAKE